MLNKYYNTENHLDLKKYFRIRKVQNVYENPKTYTKISKRIRKAQNVYENPNTYTKISKRIRKSQNVYEKHF